MSKEQDQIRRAYREFSRADAKGGSAMPGFFQLLRTEKIDLVSAKKKELDSQLRKELDSRIGKAISKHDIRKSK